VPDWENRPDSAPAPLPVEAGSAPALADVDPGTGQEVAIAVPQPVKQAGRQLTASNARSSLSAMALTIIVGLTWNIFSARRRRVGWF
ncbi:MAG: hypothetical protein ACRDZ3_03400, partial [Acidimicrobiia bacterium]